MKKKDDIGERYPELSKAEKTRRTILETALQEFVAKGYRDANMRTIAAQAGLTTGAIYRYYEDKDALFCAVTQEARELFTQKYNAMNDKAIQEAGEGITYDRADIENGSETNLSIMYDLMYAHLDAFYLLVCYSGETSLGSFVKQFVEWETANCVDYVAHLKRSQDSDYEVERSALHFIAEAYVAAMFEPIRHRMPKEEALRQIRFVEHFFIDGWLGVERQIMDKH